MKTVDVSQATAPLAEYARSLDNLPLIVTVEGEPIAALLPLDNADKETVSLSTDPRFLALIERSRARMVSEGGISASEMRRRLGQ
jgi:antitoxin (DNA-binding transcriptional repressor) of toxin-antitoxin stability system